MWFAENATEEQYNPINKIIEEFEDETICKDKIDEYLKKPPVGIPTIPTGEKPLVNRYMPDNELNQMLGESHYFLNANKLTYTIVTLVD